MNIKKVLGNPTFWLLASAFTILFVLPLTTIITDDAKPVSIDLNGHKHTVFVESDTRLVRLPTGSLPSTLFETGGNVRKRTHYPPSRMSPQFSRDHDATSQEVELYRAFFPDRK